VTDQDKAIAERLISTIETATGAFPDRFGVSAKLIGEILQAAHGLRSLLGVVRPH